MRHQIVTGAGTGAAAIIDATEYVAVGQEAQVGCLGAVPLCGLQGLGDAARCQLVEGAHRVVPFPGQRRQGCAELLGELSRHHIVCAGLQREVVLGDDEVHRLVGERC